MTMFLSIPEESEAPKYVAIADAVEAAIKDGRLAPGDALPTHRDLADELGVTVGTVTRGYAEAARRGLVRGERGRGSFVLTQRQGFGGLGLDGAVDLGLAATYHPMGPELAGTLARLAARPGLQDLMGRHASSGLPRHREAGAKWAGLYGLVADPADILVCAGAQHAVLVCLSALFSPGDRLAVGELTYPLVKPMAQRLGLRLVPLPLDAEGIDPDALDAACARERVRGLYCMPSCNNPTLARIPEYRRHELAAVCRRHGVRIVEDDAYALTVGVELPPLAALAPELTCLIASTSKSLCDGMRVAYLCAPRADVARLEAALAYTTWKAAALMAEIVSLWTEDGTARRTMAANLEEARARNAVARDILTAAGAEPVGRATGSFLWLPLPPQWRSVDFAEETARRGVMVAHQEHFAVGVNPPGQGVRVSLSGVAERPVLVRALSVLAETLQTWNVDGK